MALILLVLWVVVMAVWGLALLGAIPNAQSASPWLAFCACLILGLALLVSVPVVLVR